MDLMIANLLGFVLILTRVSTFFASMPIFNWAAIPQVVKVAMAMLLTIFFAMITPLPFDPNGISIIQAIILMCNEAIYGFALGLVATMLFNVVRMAGAIIEQEMGLNLAEIFDPMTGEPGQAVGVFLEMVFILLLFSSNFHHLLLNVLAKSYASFPLGSTPDIGLLLQGVVQAGTEMLSSALRMAAPIMAASFILMIVLAIASKVLPEMDILFISLPFKIGLGLLLLSLFLPYLDSYVWEFAKMLNKLLPT